MRQAAGTIHTCPMHPEVRQPGPGACPTCDMAPEPRTVAAEAEVNPELADMTGRFRIGLALTAPLLALAMSDLVPGQPVQHALPSRGLARVHSSHWRGDDVQLRLGHRQRAAAPPSAVLRLEEGSA